MRVSFLRISLASLIALSMPQVSLAQVSAIRGGVDTAAGAAGIQATACTGTACIITIIGNVANVMFSFLGVLLLCYLLYAGFLWTTAGGDTKKVGEAATMIRNAIVGLILTVSAFAISSFVIGQLGALTSSGNGATTPTESRT